MRHIAIYRRLATVVILFSLFPGRLSNAAERGEKNAAAPIASVPPVGATTKLSPEETIRQALGKTVTLKYDAKPLNEVCQDIEAELRVPVRIDINALNDAGVDRNIAVTFAIEKVTARSALYHLLQPLSLVATIEHEAIWITSATQAEDQWKTKVYDIADLRDPDGDPECKALIDAIVNCVESRTWCEGGGQGTLNSFNSDGIHVFIVSQIEEVHDQILDLLNQLHSMRAAKMNGRNPQEKTTASIPRGSDGGKQSTAAADSVAFAKISPAEKAIRIALDRPVQLKLSQEPFEQAVQKLAKLASVSIIIDKQSISPDKVKFNAVDLDASGRSLRAVLSELVSTVGSTWTYHGETLIIYSDNACPHPLTTRPYDLSDLPSHRNKHGEGIPDYAMIRTNISQAIETKSWIENGGPGTMSPIDCKGVHCLVISQTWENHLEIEALLAKLRKVRGRPLTQEEIAKLPLKQNVPEGYAVDPPPEPLKADAQRSSVVDATNQIAFDLHNKIAGDNRIFSPLGIATSLAVIHAGARGNTATEMAKTLHFTIPQEQVALGFQSLLAALPAANQPGCVLSSANHLWIKQGYSLQAPFVATARERFASGIDAVDFARPETACNLINAWADKQTAGKISKVIEPGDIDALKRFILTNAVYFKGKWSEPFEKSETKKAPFFYDLGQGEVELMHGLMPCRYDNIDGVQILEKPYRGGEIAMMIVLPKNEKNSLAELEKQLTTKKVNEWSSNLDMALVDLSLPKFKMESSLPLNHSLSALGMNEVFNPGKADLSGINGRKEPLWLDFVMQKAHVNVDEEGTEAAAITTTGGSGGMMSKLPEIKVFRADHPFIFFIRDTRTGCILFMGRVANPIQLAAG